MAEQDRASIPGMPPGIRTWGEEMSADFQRCLLTSVDRERSQLAAAASDESLPRADFLAISGGGADGAFGAGILSGWTAAGTRPKFKAVTGISTGALTAPFAFLGSDYDDVLMAVYTQTSTKDILLKRGLLAAVFSDAMTDNAPMWKLLSRYVDEKLLDEIAAEHQKGRILVIGTTNLDARRAVLWNIGEIAASKHPRRVEIVRSVMIASAAIPAAFPPVLLDVEVDGTKYQEMHVDGGAMTQVFLYPPSYNLGMMSAANRVIRERRVYVIRNSRLDPDWAEVDRRMLPIAGRAISALLQTQGMGDLYRLYLTSQRDSVDFNLTFIPASFKAVAKEPFDPAYMKQLYQVGFEQGRSGRAWQKTPPLYDLPQPNAN